MLLSLQNLTFLSFKSRFLFIVFFNIQLEVFIDVCLSLKYDQPNKDITIFL